MKEKEGNMEYLLNNIASLAIIPLVVTLVLMLKGAQIDWGETYKIEEEKENNIKEKKAGEKKWMVQ